MSARGAEEAHTVPYVPSASSEGHAGLVRIESRSSRSGQVRVVAVDDAGQRVEAGRLTLGAGAAVEFEMAAMESGDAALGLAGTGPGQGDWRLELTTDLDIEARAYARSEGFLTALHDAALMRGEVELPLFHPGGEARQRSSLRLANAGGEPATVAVRGVDDAGRAGAPVTVELAAWEARGYTASELESGSAAGLSGSLGDGEGKWRLFLEAERGSAYATNLLLDGPVLSSVPGGMSRGPGGLHRVSLFPSASDGAGRRGVVRVVNRSAEPAEVGIDAFDATDRAYERLRLSLGGHSSEQFDSTDLEQGSSEKGLEGSTGSGEGDWWLELTSGSDIEVLSYVDAATGPLSALRGAAGVETDAGMRYEAVLLSGAAGELRLLNAGGETVEVRVTGTDDAGASGGAVEVTLAPWASRTLTATALAEGEAGLRGALGAGTGGWRLILEADGEIDVLSLVRGAGGMLSDVSRRGRPAGAPPRTDVIDAAVSRADLRVAASASEAELSPGEAFELTATVGNVGDRGASATTLRYHRSADAAITPGDTEVGTDPVAALAAAQSIARSLSLVAPTAPGTYRYGACADAVAEETNTANNCSAAVAVTVREPPPRPDLAVTATLSDAAPEPGESFSLNAAVRNRGGAGASATTLRYRRSAAATITTTDAQVGTDAVEALVASGSSAESIRLTAPTTSGTYYYGACVDAVEGESDTTDNCSSPVRLDVAEPTAPAPDLEVGAPTVDDASLAPGESFTLSATVANAGDGAAAATTLRYHRSADAAIATTDAQVGTDAVEALVASGSSAESIRLTAPTTSGTYYYGACVDAVEGESDTTDNCSSPVRLDVAEPTAPAPDLKVGTPTVDDASLAPGESFTLSATVANAGDGAAAATTLRYHRSADAAIATTDAQVGTDAVDALAAAGSSAESIRLTAPTTSGTYYYGACVDAVEGESNATDNCSSPVRVDVAEPAAADPAPAPAPDLEVGAPTVDDASLAPGESFTLSATVTNAGDGAAAATTLRYRRSADATITTSDAEEGADAVDELAASGSSAESIALTAPPTAGSYHYGACADAVPEESATSNNCSAAVTVTVTVREPTPGPDLAVVASGPVESVLPGERIRLVATVRNVGTADAPETWIGLSRSEDAAVTPSDEILRHSGFSAMAVGDARTFRWPLVPGPAQEGTNYWVSAMAVGDTRTFGWPLTAPSTSGTYHYGACVDAVPHESDTTNNCSAVAVTVREPSGRPDLTIVASSSGPCELTATVTNVGTGRSVHTRLIWHRVGGGSTTDVRWEVSPLHPGQQDVIVSHRVVPGSYYGCVDAPPGETVTDNNCSETVEVTAH